MTIDDASGDVLEAWTGYQVPWTMARGYPGAFGRSVNALVRVDPAVRAVRRAVPREPARAARWRQLLHLDLLVLLGFSVSLAFFNARARSASRRRWSTRCWSTCWCGCCSSRGAAGRARAAAAARAGLVAGGRARLPGRLPRRPERHELERDRRRLLGRDRRRPDRRRRAAVRRRLPERQRRTATRTGRSTTTPTCRSSGSSRGAGAGTTCRPRTPRRSSSTC